MSDSDQKNVSRCGFVSIVGRPNVGKSTLLNKLIGQKLSITSRKPQTTRQQILGIKTEGTTQIIFIDTPGLHQADDSGRAINRYMNRAAKSAFSGVDVIVFVVDAKRWTEADDRVIEALTYCELPVILAINKIDKIDSKTALLPFIEKVSEKMTFTQMVPISAKTTQQLDRLEACIQEYLPEGVHHYPADQITDRTDRFLAAELVREKIMRQLGDELPYQVAVEIEEFSQKGKILHISALILVERDGQKAIVIGEKGERLRLIGQEARLDMEKAFESKVMLKLWVKVKGGWSDDDRALRSLGYE
jgi:GTP-binding protein Era